MINKNQLKNDSKLYIKKICETKVSIDLSR